MIAGKSVGVVTLVLLAVVAGVVGIAGAQAQTGAIPIDSCRTIADDGRYVLTTDIENSNRKVCIHIISSDVVFDGAGHTIDSGPNTTESVGIKVNNSLTTISNVTIENVTTTGWTVGVYYLGATNGTLRDVNASANRRYGILLRAADGTRLRNVTAVGNGRWSLFLVNTTNVTGTNVEIGSATISFTASNVALTGISNPPAGPENRTTIGQYVGAASTGRNASLRLAVSYTAQNVTSANVTERTLRMWAFDGSGPWTKPSGVNFVNIERNRVVADVQSLQNASTFAPAGVVRTPTPTPTPTPTATPTPTPETTDTAGANAQNTQTATATSSDDESGAFGPGFGVVAAVVAVCGAAFLTLRRR